MEDRKTTDAADEKERYSELDERSLKNPVVEGGKVWDPDSIDGEERKEGE